MEKISVNPIGALVFLITYILISARRLSLLKLDRPAGALVGAVLCVALRVLSPEEAIHAVNGETLLLLFGVMGLGAFLGIDGFFEAAGEKLVQKAGSARRLLGLIVWGAGILAALITNDAVCVLGSPIVVSIIQRHGLPPLPYLLALATAANTGSVATLVGNPQNMLCGILGNLSFRHYFFIAAPLAVVCLLVNHLILDFAFRKQLTARFPSHNFAGRKLVNRQTGITLAVIALTVLLYMLGADLAWSAAGAFALLLVIHGRDSRLLWGRIDWSVLLFFAGLFTVVEGFVRSGVPKLFFERFPLAEQAQDGLGVWIRVAMLFLFGSNVVSNVPFILVIQHQMPTLPNPTLAWELLAVSSTFAGNLTLLGSVANIIVAESARQIGGIGFIQYAKVGLPLGLITTLIGSIWLYAVEGP